MSKLPLPVSKSPFVLSLGEDLYIRGDVFLPEGDSILPVVVFCHGFKGFKDWGCWPTVATKIAEADFAVITFNFSRNGVGADGFEFTELDKFRVNTFSHELEDLLRVIKAAQLGKLPGAERFAQRFGLIGHSRGGFAAVCGSAKLPATVHSLVTLSAISGVYREDPSREARWTDDGVIYVRNARTGQELPLGVELLYDMRAQKDAIATAAQSLSIPSLVIHGDADEAVNISSAIELSEWMTHSELLMLPGATHTFGATHPFKGFTTDLTRVVNELRRFFTTTLALH